MGSVPTKRTNGVGIIIFFFWFCTFIRGLALCVGSVGGGVDASIIYLFLNDMCSGGPVHIFFFL